MCTDLASFSKSIRNWAKANSDIRAVILFGSRARGDYTESSDWDICVLLNVSNTRNGEWYGKWIAIADSLKTSFCEAVGLDESNVQFVAPTSDEVKNGIAECSKVIYVSDEPKRAGT